MFSEKLCVKKRRLAKNDFVTKQKWKELTTKNFILLNEGLRAYIQENMHSKERSKMEKERGGEDVCKLIVS